MAGHVDLERHILDVPDWPEPGVDFKNITPLLADPAGLADTIRRVAEPFEGQGVTKVVGMEARGFVIELSFLGGRSRLGGHRHVSLLTY